MMATSRLKFDEIGEWSEVKLDIVRDYAAAYSRTIAAQTRPRLHHLYIDAFAGAGVHVSRATGQHVLGSPLNALLVNPPFREYVLIDIEATRVESLRGLVGDRPDVLICHGDCNRVLLADVFPKVQYQDYRRALCLLDPYGLHLEWPVIATAGTMGSVELFVNFPVADMNRNVFWRYEEGASLDDINRMNLFWGDGSWRGVVYSTTDNLFGWSEKTADNETIAQAFRERLRTVAGFAHVPDPLPMRNGANAIVYYLFFASQNRTGDRIVRDIFKKHARR